MAPFQRPPIKTLAVASGGAAILLLLIMTSQSNEHVTQTIGATIVTNEAFGNAAEMDTSDWEAYRTCQTKRLKRLKERCYNTGYRQFKPYNRVPEKSLRKLVQYVIVDHKHQTLIRSVPKSGCSSWKSIFLAGMESSEELNLPNTINNWTMLAEHGLLRLQLEPSAKKIRRYLEDYFFLLTVRHPFTRLESAYRSKFGHHNALFMRLAGNDIIRRYRGNQTDPGERIQNENRNSEESVGDSEEGDSTELYQDEGSNEIEEETYQVENFDSSEKYNVDPVEELKVGHANGFSVKLPRESNDDSINEFQVYTADKPDIGLTEHSLIPNMVKDQPYDIPKPLDTQSLVNTQEVIPISQSDTATYQRQSNNALLHGESYPTQINNALLPTRDTSYMLSETNSSPIRDYAAMVSQQTLSRYDQQNKPSRDVTRKLGVRSREPDTQISQYQNAPLQSSLMPLLRNDQTMPQNNNMETTYSQSISAQGDAKTDSINSLPRDKNAIFKNDLLHPVHTQQSNGYTGQYDTHPLPIQHLENSNIALPNNVDAPLRSALGLSHRLPYDPLDAVNMNSQPLTSKVGSLYQSQKIDGPSPRYDQASTPNNNVLSHDISSRIFPANPLVRTQTNSPSYTSTGHKLKLSVKPAQNKNTMDTSSRYMNSPIETEYIPIHAGNNAIDIGNNPIETGNSPIDTGNTNKRSRKRRRKRRAISLERNVFDAPTFEEFVRYVIDRDLRPFNRHWDTYEEIAHPCAFLFSHIAKTESADLDMDFVSTTRLSRDHLKMHKNQHGVVIGDDVTSGSSVLMSDLPYFETLPIDKEELVAKIRDRYKTDMELFGYTLGVDKETGFLKTGCEEYGQDGMCC